MTDNGEQSPDSQLILPGCERHIAPKSSSLSDEGGQGLLAFYQPPTLAEQMTHACQSPLRAKAGQLPLPGDGLFGQDGID